MSFTAPKSTVYLVDDCPDELLLVRTHCESLGLNVRSFQSPATFLEETDSQSRGCVVVDLLMPQMTGLQLFAAMRQKGITMPIIVVTGHADAGTCRLAFNNGVFDFLEKNFNPHELLEVIQRALLQHEEEFERREMRDEFLEKLGCLSSREKEVMYQLADGRTLKEIAAEFCISVQTASKHRGNLFRKLSISNEIELLKLLIAIDPNHALQTTKTSCAA